MENTLSKCNNLSEKINKKSEFEIYVENLVEDFNKYFKHRDEITHHEVQSFIQNKSQEQKIPDMRTLLLSKNLGIPFQKQSFFVIFLNTIHVKLTVDKINGDEFNKLNYYLDLIYLSGGDLIKKLKSQNI